MKSQNTRAKKQSCIKEDFLPPQEKVKVELSKPESCNSNLLALTAREIIQPYDKIHAELKLKMRVISQFFENLPVSDEINIDEENTNPIEHALLGLSNYGFSMDFDFRNNSFSYELTNIMPLQMKDSTNKSGNEKKRKPEEPVKRDNYKQIKITS